MRNIITTIAITIKTTVKTIKIITIIAIVTIITIMVIIINIEIHECHSYLVKILFLQDRKVTINSYGTSPPQPLDVQPNGSNIVLDENKMDYNSIAKDNKTKTNNNDEIKSNEKNRRGNPSSASGQGYTASMTSVIEATAEADAPSITTLTGHPIGGSGSSGALKPNTFDLMSPVSIMYLGYGE